MESYLPCLARAKISSRFVLYGKWRFALRGARRRVVLCRDLPTVIERKRTLRKLHAFCAAFCAAVLLLVPATTARPQAPASAAAPQRPAANAPGAAQAATPPTRLEPIAATKERADVCAAEDAAGAEKRGCV